MDAIKSRPQLRNRYLLIGDLMLIIVSVMGSFALKLDAGQLPYYLPAMLIMCGVALLVKIPTYYCFWLVQADVDLREYQ